MLIKTQTDIGTTDYINTEHVAAWEIKERDSNADLYAIIPGIDGDSLFVGTFESQKKAENWLGRMQTGMTAGRQFMAVPSLAEQNIEKERAQWD